MKRKLLKSPSLPKTEQCKKPNWNKLRKRKLLICKSDTMTKTISILLAIKLAMSTMSIRIRRMQGWLASREVVSLLLKTFAKNNLTWFQTSNNRWEPLHNKESSRLKTWKLKTLLKNRKRKINKNNYVQSWISTPKIKRTSVNATQKCKDTKVISLKIMY